jgi:hypothetical protein
MLTPDSRVANALYYMKRVEFDEIPSSCCLLILGSYENGAISKAILAVHKLIKSRYNLTKGDMK